MRAGEAYPDAGDAFRFLKDWTASGRHRDLSWSWDRVIGERDGDVLCIREKATGAGLIALENLPPKLPCHLFFQVFHSYSTLLENTTRSKRTLASFSGLETNGLRWTFQAALTLLVLQVIRLALGNLKIRSSGLREKIQRRGPF